MTCHLSVATWGLVLLGGWWPEGGDASGADWGRWVLEGGQAVVKADPDASLIAFHAPSPFFGARARHPSMRWAGGEGRRGERGGGGGRRQNGLGVDAGEGNPVSRRPSTRVPLREFLVGWDAGRGFGEWVNGFGCAGWEGGNEVGSPSAHPRLFAQAPAHVHSGAPHQTHTRQN